MWRNILPLLGLVMLTSADTYYSLNTTFNLVKHLKSIKASNTCGEEGDEMYCLLTGTPLAPGLDYQYSRYPGTYVDGQFCNVCKPSQHNISNAVDEDLDNWWQSSSLANIDTQSMTIDLEFGQEYQAVYFVLKAANSPRPARWVLEKSVDHGLSYKPWQIYVPTDDDCQTYYNISASHFPVNFLRDDQVLCTSYYGTLDPLENGQIYTSLVIGRPGAEFFYLNESPRLQSWMKATNVRLRLEAMQVIHNIVREEDDTANRRFFYSIREIIIAGRCSCNGHAAECVKSSETLNCECDHEHALYHPTLTCQCEDNTCGANCNECCPGFNQLPWQPSSSGQHYACEECQCFGHSSDCYYDENTERRKGSMDINGSYRGGGVCRGCVDNTTGVNCERCKEGYFRGLREDLYSKTCRKCNCNTANIILVPGLEFGSCDHSRGGQCYCKPEFTGRRCDECRGNYYNTLVSGLQCKYCDCNTRGTVSQLESCSDVLGQCLCKQNVQGVQCNECKEGFHSLSVNNDYGCADCGCSTGGSESPVCDKLTGQCTCKDGIIGRKCDVVAPKHYIPSTDFLTLEAEDGIMAGRQALYDFKQGVFKEGYFGRGYAALNSYVPSVQMTVTVPQYSRYNVSIRYQLPDSFQSYTGYITARKVEGGPEQTFPVSLETCKEGCDVVMSERLVLTPGEWIISFSYNSPTINLDHIILTPRLFIEPTVTQTDLPPCTISTSTLCKEFKLPSLDLSTVEEQELQGDRVVFNVDKADTVSFVIDYIFKYLGTGLNATVEVTDGTVTKNGYITLHSCDQLQGCRLILRDEEGKELVFDTEAGQLVLTFKDGLPQDLDDWWGSNNDVSWNEYFRSELTGSLALVRHSADLMSEIQPQFVCVKGVDSQCTAPFYSIVYPKTTRPASKGTLIFPSGGKKSVPSSALIERIDGGQKKQFTELCGDSSKYEVKLVLIGSPSSYRIIIEYFYTGASYSLSDMSVSVTFSDEKSVVANGVITFKTCDGYSVCRALIMNTSPNSTQHSTPYFKFSSRKVVMKMVDFPEGKCVLVDSFITTASQLQTSSLITPLPLSRTEEFILYCPTLASNTTALCQNGYMGLAAEFFSGLPYCDCDVEGSESDRCNQLGGQCFCKENIIGRQCDRCKAGYFGFPDCRVCPRTHCSVAGSGFSSICDETSGDCKCAPNVIGDSCEACAGDAFGYDALLGCKECECNVNGSSGNSCTEDGVCYCTKETIVGDKCEQCASGTTSYPECVECGCDERGSRGSVCNGETGQCPCKGSATGKLCDECKYGNFNLQLNSTLGCEECFCFGVTQNCTSGSMSYDKIGREFSTGNAQGWHFADLKTLRTQQKPLVDESPRYPGLYEIVVDSVSVITMLKEYQFVWLSPYKGDLTASYGGKMQFTLGYFPAVTEDAEYRPYIVIKGKYGELRLDLELPEPGSYSPYSVKLEAGRWFDDYFTMVDKAKLMSVLLDVEHIFIRGDVTSSMATYKLLSVSLDTSFVNNNGGLSQISYVEQCSCPEGYQGASCQYCVDGYYRVKDMRSRSFLGACVKCDCNGHSDICDKATGVCEDCEDNTFGPHCEQCNPGYYGNPGSGGDCGLCPCPLPLEGNVFGNCSYSTVQGTQLQCACEPGYSGYACGTCDQGYYGNPRIPGGECTQCGDCNGNTNTKKDYCDRETGDCTICRKNSAGAQCEVCAPGYFGDAIDAKNCIACQCDPEGSVDSNCNITTGACTCLPGVVGDLCDRCEVGMWNLTQDIGCESCNCNNNGTLDGYCNEDTGLCECQSGVEGAKCEECEDGFYGLASLGHCTACDCNEYGSLSNTCNKKTGQCPCGKGMTGLQCDICDSWAIITQTGCVECEGCSKVLKDWIDELVGDINAAIQLKDRGGRVNEDIDRLIAMKNNATLIQAEALRNARVLDQRKGALGMTYPLKTSSVKYKYNKLNYDFKNTLQKRVDEVEQVTEVSNSRAMNVVTKVMSANSSVQEHVKLLKDSMKLISDLKITSDSPKKIKAALVDSKKQIQKMKKRVLYKPDKDLINQLRTLNSEVNATFGSVAEKNITSVSSTIEGISKAMRGVHGLTVTTVLGPIDEFSGISDSITGDLSNSEGAFRQRRAAVQKDIESLSISQSSYSTNASIIDSLVSQSSTYLMENFSPYGQNLTSMVLKTTEEKLAVKVRAQGGTDVSAGLKKRTSKLEAFVKRKDDSLVSKINTLQRFVNQTADLAMHSAYLTVSSKVITKQVSDWNSNDLKNKLTSSRYTYDMGTQMNVTVSSMKAKVESDTKFLDMPSKAELTMSLRARLYDITSTVKQHRKSKTSVDKLMKEVEGVREVVRRVNKINEKIDNSMHFDKSENKLDKLLNKKEVNDNHYKAASALFTGSKPFTSRLATLITQSKTNISVVDKMRVLDQRLAQIKFKISQTRDMAASVQVGVEMRKPTYISLPMPLVAQQSRRYTSVSMMIKTNAVNGTILYMASSENNDFFHVKLVNSKVQMQFDIGDGSTVVPTDVIVGDDEWHKITASRNGREGVVTVDSGNGRIQSFSGRSEVDVNLLLELNAFGYFFIGATKESINKTKSQDRFKGSITQLKITGTDVGLWGYKENGGYMSPTQATVVYNKKNGKRALCLKGWGYAQYSGIPLTDSTIIKIVLQTYTRNAAILQIKNFDKEEKIELWMTNGGLTLNITRAYEETLPVVFTEIFATGDPINIDIAFQSSMVVLTATQSLKQSTPLSKSGSTTMKTALNWKQKDQRDFFIGGDGVVDSLAGCVKSVIIDNIPLSLSQDNAHTYIGASELCPGRTIPGVVFSGSGYSRYPAADFNQNFQLDLYIRTENPYGVIVFGTDALSFNTFSLSVVNGEVEFVSMRDYKKNVARTDVKVNDGNWHSLQLLRREEKITLIVDGYTASAVLRDNVDYQTNHALYLGGIPTSNTLLLDVVPELVRFEGDMRNFLINEQYVDLEKYIETEGVSYYGCQLRPPVKSFTSLIQKNLTQL